MTEKPPIGDEIKKIQQRELDDFDKQLDEITGAPETPPAALEPKPAEPPKPEDVPLSVAGPEISIPKPAAEEVKPEDKPVASEKTIEELKADLEGKRKIYAQLDLDKSRKWTRLKNLLGAGIKEVKDGDFDRVWGEYEEAKGKYFEAKRADVLGKGDKESVKEFLREFEGADEAIKFLNLKYDLKKEQSGYPAKILYGFEKLANGWKEMSWKKKLLISGAIFGLGFAATATAGLTFGGLGALAFTARTAQRALGAGAMYIGAKKWQDTRAMKKIQERTGENIEELLSDNNWIDRIANLEYGQHIRDRFRGQKEEVEALDKKHKRRALVLAGMIGIGGTAFDMYRQGYFGLIRDKAMGVGGAVKDKLFRGGIKGSNLKNIGASLGVGLHEDVGRALTHSPGGTLPDGKTMIINPKGLEELEGGPIKHIDGAPELPGDDKEMLRNLSAAAEPEVKGGGVVPELEAKMSELRAPDAPEKIAELGVREIPPVKIGAGGTMWGSIENSIKANPGAYGLDPEDANFTEDMRKMTKTMLDEFASRKGLSYEQLDQIARTKLRAGDSFKIVWNPSNDDIYIDDFSGKAFGADVAQAEALVQEVAGSKAGVAPEEMKPKAGAGVAEQQPSRVRGAGRYKLPEDILEQERIAKENWAKASRYAEDVAKWKAEAGPQIEQMGKAAGLQQYLSTRGLFNQIVKDATVGERANFWAQPISEWDKLLGAENYIESDVSDKNAVAKLNSNKKILKKLYPILKMYTVHGGESVDECLRKAITDSTPVRGGQTGASVGAYNLRFINQEILKK